MSRLRKKVYVDQLESKFTEVTSLNKALNAQVNALLEENEALKAENEELREALQKRKKPRMIASDELEEQEQEPTRLPRVSKATTQVSQPMVVVKQEEEEIDEDSPHSIYEERSPVVETRAVKGDDGYYLAEQDAVEEQFEQAFDLDAPEIGDCIVQDLFSSATGINPPVPVLDTTNDPHLVNVLDTLPAVPQQLVPFDTDSLLPFTEPYFFDLDREL